MKPDRSQPVLVLALLLLSLGIVFIPAADAKPTIHSLIVVMDEDASIGPSVDKDKRIIQGLLQEIADKGICSTKSTYLLSSKKKATADRIKNWLKAVDPSSDDVVFVYFSGHGGMLKEQGTYIALQGEILFRKSLVRLLEQAKDCRLKMLITDSCSSLPRSQVTPQAAPTLEAAFQHLFVKHRGFLHLAAASEGEYAYGNSQKGGWFTASLINTMYDRPDPNGDGFVSWKEVFEETRKRTMQLFTKAYPRFSAKRKRDLSTRGIKSQTPRYYGSLPVPIR